MRDIDSRVRVVGEHVVVLNVIAWTPVKRLAQ